MKKDIVLFVLIEPFADWEGAALAAELQKPSLDNPEKTFTVKTVSLSHEPIKSIGGFTVVPDYSLEDAPEDYAALILIGGDSWRKPESANVVCIGNRNFCLGLRIGNKQFKTLHERGNHRYADRRKECRFGNLYR